MKRKSVSVCKSNYYHLETNQWCFFFQMSTEAPTPSNIDMSHGNRLAIHQCDECFSTVHRAPMRIRMMWERLFETVAPFQSQFSAIACLSFDKLECSLLYRFVWSPHRRLWCWKTWRTLQILKLPRFESNVLYRLPDLKWRHIVRIRPTIQFNMIAIRLNGLITMENVSDIIFAVVAWNAR